MRDFLGLLEEQRDVWTFGGVIRPSSEVGFQTFLFLVIDTLTE